MKEIICKFVKKITFGKVCLDYCFESKCKKNGKRVK